MNYYTHIITLLTTLKQALLLLDPVFSVIIELNLQNAHTREIHCLKGLCC